ncbi:hypothetical protein QF036_002229 [Arthrobacter globiformis]|nr:hypothetical protein [Arthrobacter globiformis]
MKDALETVKILAAYDLTKSLRAAAELSGCSHHTVDRPVQARDAGRAPGAVPDRPRVTDAWLPKIEEWVEKSKGRIRADVVHAKATSSARSK